MKRQAWVIIFSIIIVFGSDIFASDGEIFDSAGFVVNDGITVLIKLVGLTGYRIILMRIKCEAFPFAIKFKLPFEYSCTVEYLFLSRVIVAKRIIEFFPYQPGIEMCRSEKYSSARNQRVR